MQLDDSTFFINIAVIAATLLGLTFIALTFFLLDILKRYEGIAMPIFRQRDKNNEYVLNRKTKPWETLTDYQFFDYDPLVLFNAFSTTLAWNLFQLPLIIGLTITWCGDNFIYTGIELLIFFFILTFNFYTRNDIISKLKPYLTRDELLWGPILLVSVIIYFTAASVVLLIGIANLQIVSTSFHLPSEWNISNNQIASGVLKFICIFSLISAIYWLNKDIFIFFKSVAAERMRIQWLTEFFSSTYMELNERVKKLFPIRIEILQLI